MELLYLSFEIQVIVYTTASVLIFLYCNHCISTEKRSSAKNVKTKEAPRAAGAWPIIGHLHLLSGSNSKPPHVVLGDMADKYGPLFTIKLGVHQALVVSDWKTAKECLITNDQAFLNRPKALAVELMGYNYGMFGLGPYNSYWRKMKKIVTHELLSNSRVQMFEHVRVSEVRQSMKDIYDFWVNNNETSRTDDGMVKIDMEKWFGSLTLNIVLRILMGKRFPWIDREVCRNLKPIRKFTELLVSFIEGDYLPCLRWLDIGGHEKTMKETAKEIDSIVGEWLEEHKIRRRRNLTAEKQHHDEDFMDVLLSIFDESVTTTKDFAGFQTDTIIKSTCLTLLSGANDTILVSLTWALCLLLNHRDVLKKAKDELNFHVGTERQVEEIDLKNLVYFQAIIKESLRLYPGAGQLMAPRESNADCVVGGYKIPRGTRLVVNFSKVHRDPRVWPNPNEFQPERFLSSHKHLDVRGHNFELIPFGSGRRICPGISLALQVMELGLASLIHGFELETPSKEPIDMRVVSGISNFKDKPFEVLLKPLFSFQN